MRQEKRRYNVVCCGRRWGKTSEGMNLAIEKAASGLPVAWCSPTYKMMTSVWQEFVEVLEPITKRKSVAENQLQLLGGGLIDLWSLDAADTIRGRPYARVIVDEAARVPHLLNTWYKAIRPTLTDHRGDGWFLSTPYGLNGFHSLWQLGQDPLEPDWQSWQFPTSSNPFIDVDEIAAAKRDMPEQDFRQEYLAEFLTDGNNVFRRLAEAATAVPLATGADGGRYVFGVDWGKLHDFSVFSVFDPTTRRQVALERFNQIDYRVQLGRLQALCGRFPPKLIVAEINSIGEPLVENLQALRLPVVGFKTTAQSKKAIVEALSLGFEKGSLKILPDRVQRGELEAFEAKRTPSGLLAYGAPEGLHDDTVMALALAWAGVLNQPQAMTQSDFRFVA